MLVGQCGYYSFCAFQIYVAKESAKEQLLRQLPDHFLTRIEVSSNISSIHWEEEGKEFSLDGEMYDVVRTTVEKGKLYLLCFSDTKEDQLMETLQKVIKANADSSPNTGKHHLAGKTLLADWVLGIHEEVIVAESIAVTTSFHFDQSQALLNSFIKVNFPPPNLNFKLNKQT
jgi:hypothetical protein